MINTAQYASYKNLLVYEKAKDLSVKAIKYFYQQKPTRNFDFLVNQLLRSLSSIGANIAEGYGRHYQKNYRQFLSIARGSSFESDYWLEVILDTRLFDQSIITNFINQNVEIMKMLTTLMKNTAI